MKRLSAKAKNNVAAYASKNKCRAFEIVLTVRFVSDDDFGTVEKVARAVSNQFNPAGRKSMGLPLKEKNGKGKFARLPGHLAITDLTVML